MDQEVKTNPGRPKKSTTKVETISSLKKEVTELKQKLSEAQENAQANFDFAKAADKESRRLREDFLQEGQRMSNVIETVQQGLTMIETGLTLLRKGIYAELTRNQRKGEQEDGDQN